jgi:GAF domain-containing protein
MSTPRVDHGALRHVMSEYAAALVDGDDDVTEVLYRLANQCTAVLDVAGAGVSLRDAAGELECVTATDGRASRMEQEQLARSDGPSFHAHRAGRTVAVADLLDDPRWEDLRDIAHATGYRGVASLPMPVGRAPVGTLSVYDTEARDWTDADLEVATLLADLAAGFVLMARSLTDAHARSAQLQHALDSRVVVEQAKGMLAARLGIDIDEGFELLRAHARGHRVSVRDAASDVVAGRLELDVPSPRPVAGQP